MSERNYVYLAENIKEVMKYHLRRMVTSSQVEVIPASMQYFPESAGLEEPQDEQLAV